tara:strand:+ start:398 stop:520 length:123 start_codon:yes stop_codon:yes gene_type:complete
MDSVREAWVNEFEMPTKLSPVKVYEDKRGSAEKEKKKKKK